MRVALADSRRQAPLTPRQQFVIGTVAGGPGDRLVLAGPGTAGTLRVARADLRGLAGSRGVPGRAESAVRQGASLALVTALGLLLLHIGYDADRPFGSAAGAAAVDGAVGFGVGAALGAVSPSERWRSVRLR